jgi:carbon monoxide dehydrogenase subunit G
MAKRTIETTMHIANAPEAVLGYIADVRHRTAYLPSLKALTDVRGEPSAVGTTWHWRWAMLGREFEGTGRCTEHQPGRLYAFRTEGGLESAFTYKAEPDGDGTRLTISAEFEVPDGLLAQLPSEALLERMGRLEAELVTLNLKALLDRPAAAPCAAGDATTA